MVHFIAAAILAFVPRLPAETAGENSNSESSEILMFPLRTSRLDWEST